MIRPIYWFQPNSWPNKAVSSPKLHLSIAAEAAAVTEPSIEVTTRSSTTMAPDGKFKTKNGSGDPKGRKRQYLPHNRPVKKKGYPLRPGVQGFFITCDGGREQQASREAINVFESFYEELLLGNGSTSVAAKNSLQPANKKIKFDSSSEEDEDSDDEAEKEEESKSNGSKEKDTDHENQKDETSDPKKENESAGGGDKTEKVAVDSNENGKTLDKRVDEAPEPPSKKQCLENDSSKVVAAQKEEKSIDRLIEEELEELADKKKRSFMNIDSGCNGVVFVQMRKRDGGPGPGEIVHHLMTSAASTRKHMSRFILRVLPIEASCYSSEEEISKAIQPLVEKYFPVETDNPQKFAVLYDARANTGVDRAKVINSVAKAIPGPHKVDLNNPDKSIIVQIVKTVCLIGVVEKYKELAKYNLRQLTSPQT